MGYKINRYYHSWLGGSFTQNTKVSNDMLAAVTTQ